MSFAIPPRAAHGVGDMAVTPHELATQAALDVMADGNAIDGAIAANAMLGVVAPETCGPGGDLFALVHVPGEAAPLALNASGRAGSQASPAALRDQGHAGIPVYGPESITVPGCVDGWAALSARLGSRPLAECLTPARAAAAGGFPVSPELAGALARRPPAFAAEAAAQALLPGGAPPAAGAVVTRPDLAATLEAVAEAGRDGFYGGTAGDGIVAATGGVITAEDLARDQAEWVEPLGARVGTRTGWTIPPNSQGWLALAAIAIFFRVGDGLEPADPRYLHLQIEAYRSAAWQRDDLTADPHHAPLPPADLVDAERLAGWAAAISPDRAGRWPAPQPAPAGTAYLCTIDRAGLGVSFIQSNFHGLGSGIGAGASGVLLHNRGAGFSLTPGHPNELGPGKRPLHTLSPTLWTADGGLELLLGTRGGHQQPQLLLQAAAYLLAVGDAPAAAQARPRWTMDEFGAGTASLVNVEERMDGSIVAGLRDRGHRVTVAEPWMGGWGPISVIAVGENGLRTGAADPRVSTATAAAR